jgi:hypothetical protein
MAPRAARTGAMAVSTTNSNPCGERDLQQNLVICLVDDQTAYITCRNKVLHILGELVARKINLFV